MPRHMLLLQLWNHGHICPTELLFYYMAFQISFPALFASAVNRASSIVRRIRLRKGILIEHFFGQRESRMPCSPMTNFKLYYYMEKTPAVLRLGPSCMAKSCYQLRSWRER